MTAEVVDAVASDWRPSRVESREAIRKAVVMAAMMNGGEVHIAQVRAFLPDTVIPEQIGATLYALQARKFLVWTGEYRPNGDTKSGNASKPSKVCRLIRPIAPGDLA